MAWWNRKRKLNCWEFMQCGREPGGARSFDLGICPSAIDGLLGGVNHGKNRGRICWQVAACDTIRGITYEFQQLDVSLKSSEREITRCEQGRCHDCPFYAYVNDQEGRRLQVPIEAA